MGIFRDSQNVNNEAGPVKTGFERHYEINNFMGHLGKK
jgi:hypothetical protein